MGSTEEEGLDEDSRGQCDDPQWDCSALQVEDVGDLVRENAYVGKLYNSAGLHVLQQGKAEQAWSDGNALGLFRLFLPRQQSEKFRTWLNKKLEKRGKKAVNEMKFNAYIGLELATSLIGYNSLAEYWSTSMFSGHEHFKATMSRDDFMEIRASMTFYATEAFDDDLSPRDPMWHARSLLLDFQKRCAAIAVPIGPCAIDENTVRTKARTGARSYIKGKPDPYGIRFYAPAAWVVSYLFTFWDNNSGNKTGIPAVRRYIHLFKRLRTPYTKFFYGTTHREVDGNSATALWIMMLALLSIRLPDPTWCRVVFMDNYYTRHNFGMALKEFTDGDVRITGTVRMNFVDATSKPNVERGVAVLKDKERGSWVLIAALQPIPDLAKIRRKHQENEKKRKRAGQPATELQLPEAEFSPNAGYIAFKDSKIVLFYSNDLAVTRTTGSLKCSYKGSRSPDKKPNAYEACK